MIRHLARLSSKPGRRFCSNLSDGGIDLHLAISKKIETTPVLIFSKSTCPFCTKVQSVLENAGVHDQTIVQIDEYESGAEIQKCLATITGQRTVPNVFIRGNHVGGCDDTIALLNSGQLVQMIEKPFLQ